MSRRRNSPWLIASTFAAALALTVVPLPDSLVWFRPYWVALVLIYWCIETPDQVGMGVGFSMGLLLDIMTELDVSPAQTVMVGDTVYDLEMAQQAGTHCVAVGYGAHEPAVLLEFEPHTILANIEELPRVLERF